MRSSNVPTDFIEEVLITATMVLYYYILGIQCLTAKYIVK